MIISAGFEVEVSLKPVETVAEVELSVVEIVVLDGDDFIDTDLVLKVRKMLFELQL